MALRLIIGDDPVLVGEAVIAAVDELVGTGDRSLMLETLTEADYRNDSGGYEPSKVLDAVRTPPFLTDRRVVVGRHLSRFSKKEDYLPIVDLDGDGREEVLWGEHCIGAGGYDLWAIDERVPYNGHPGVV